MNNLKQNFYKNPYKSYTYSYPHKSAYRYFDKPFIFDDVWKDEDISNLFLYLHIPFCKNKCSYCNLFSFIPGTDIVERYLKAVETQINAYKEFFISNAQYSLLAIGGGTPTLLDLKDLEKIFLLINDISSYLSENLPLSVEISPTEIDKKKLSLLKRYKTTRISIGIQSFDKNTLQHYGRASTYDRIHPVLNAAKETGFQRLNMDLIYGGKNFDMKAWENSLSAALSYNPEEIYLYPLYVRQGTPLYTTDHNIPEDTRLNAYIHAKNFLQSNGYKRISKRRFYRQDSIGTADTGYSCQENGMVGLGCGARSYTAKLHYSHPYSTDRNDIKKIVDRYSKMDKKSFGIIDYGFVVDKEESMRRYLLKTLFINEGLDRVKFKKEFDQDLLDVFPEIRQLSDEGLADITSSSIRLTDEGMDLSDAISPWLYSGHVKELMEHADGQ